MDDDFELAIELHRSERFDEAEAAYRRRLVTSPDHVDGLHYFGVLLHQTGRSDEGMLMIQRAIALDPGDPALYHNLGSVLNETGRLEEAVGAYQKSLEIEPENPSVWSNLALVHKSLGELKKAERCGRRAVDLDPDSAAAHSNLGQVLVVRDKTDEGIACYLRAIELGDHDPDTYRYLGMVLGETGRRSEAAEVFRHWLDLDPENETARYLLAAHTGSDVPDRMPDSYVREHFDWFSSSFDASLAEIDYQGPQLVVDALAADLGAPDGSLDILDAGCGTGLVAPLLAPYARRLVGVDLAPRMLDHARRLGLYDELAEAELTEWIEARPDTFDMIVAIDLFIYIGRLERVVHAMTAALRPDGRLGFTVEHLVDPTDGPGFRLNAHGRYGQSEAYVRRVLGKAGLEIRSLDTADLRLEKGVPASGLVVVATRTSATRASP